MEKLKEKALKAINHYNNLDLDLGFRKLLDLALDTDDLGFFKKSLAFTEAKFSNLYSQEQEIVQAKNILEEIAQVDLTSNFESEHVIIKANQISKKYNKGNFNLGPVSLEVKTGEILGLVGENGNGKTTLLRILGRELETDQGEINYSFRDKTANSYALKSKLVYIPQRIQTLRGTLMDNLQFTLAQHYILDERNMLTAQMYLARLGLWPYKNLAWSRLSSGYKMRFELARTLCRKPELLLLDEPLANLDILAQQIILEDLTYLANSLSHPFGIILSSQQLYEVEKISDKVIFLQKGKMQMNAQNDLDETVEQNQTILELDVKCDREELLQHLTPIGLEKLQYNGGNFVAYFPSTVSVNQILSIIGQTDLQLIYLRDISQSSRRFFVK